jgi:acetylglutamate kinase
MWRHDLWQIKKNIVAQLQAHNLDGFSGADGNLIQSEKETHHQLRICR